VGGEVTAKNVRATQQPKSPRKLTKSERAMLATYRVGCLYSLQPVANLRSIQNRGILSHKRVQQLGLLHHDISDPEIQQYRVTKVVAGRPLHDYVPLFFRTETPMQYKVCIERAQANEVAVLEVDVGVFGVSGIVFTDRYAFSSKRNEYQDLDDLRNLDWADLDDQSRLWAQARSRRSAEVLIPDQVPATYIRRVCVTRACRWPRGLSLPWVRDESVFPWGVS